MGGMSGHKWSSPTRGEAEYLPSRKWGKAWRSHGGWGHTRQHTTYSLVVIPHSPHPTRLRRPSPAARGKGSWLRLGWEHVLYIVRELVQHKPRTGHHTYQPVGNPRGEMSAHRHNFPPRAEGIRYTSPWFNHGRNERAAKVSRPRRHFPDVASLIGRGQHGYGSTAADLLTTPSQPRVCLGPHSGPCRRSGRGPRWNGGGRCRPVWCRL